MSVPDLERLFAEHSQKLYGFLAYRIGNPTVAEDLLGDTFERVVRSRRRFDPRRGSQETWLYTIALNCLRDHLRRLEAEGRAVDRLRVDEASWESDASARVEDRDALFRCLDLLDAGEREVIALRYGADLRLQDIARVTGEPLTTVQGRLYRGLDRLRTALEREETAVRLPRTGAR